MTNEEFEKKARAIRKKLLDESIRNKPSIYSLENAGAELFGIVTNLNTENDELVPSLLSLKSDLDIYLVDLGGELKHDYDKNNKRYKDKWIIESRKISEFIYRLKKYLSEEQTEK